MKLKMIFAVLMVALAAYGISVASAATGPSTTVSGMSPLSPIGGFGPMQVSSASSNGLGVGGVAGHAGTLSLWRIEGNLNIPVAIEPATITQAVFSMNDGTGKTILILTRSYTDSIWDYDPAINQFRYEALMKITAIDPTNGAILWDETVVTDTYTDA